MADKKFSAFSTSAKATTDYVVGYTGANNVKLTPADLVTDVDLTSDVTGQLPLANGGTGQANAQDALNSLTNIAGASVDEILTYNGADAIFKKPSDNSYIPSRRLGHYEWLDDVSAPYFNVLHGSTTIIPFNSTILETTSNPSSTFGFEGWTRNLLSTTNSNFTLGADGSGWWKVTARLHFYDLYADLDVQCFLYDSSTGLVEQMIIDNKVVEGSQDQMYQGTIIQEFSAGDSKDIRVLFSGGTAGQNPFPSASNNARTSVTFEFISA